MPGFSLFFNATTIIFLITIGMLGLFGLSHSLLKELSLGTIVLGIGMIGMLKAIAEMIENHGQAGEVH